MGRRSFLAAVFAFGAALAAVAASPRPAGAVDVHVRRGVKRWINRHRRYLHYHLPRRRR